MESWYCLLLDAAWTCSLDWKRYIEPQIKYTQNTYRIQAESEPLDQASSQSDVENSSTRQNYLVIIEKGAYLCSASRFGHLETKGIERV